MEELINFKDYFNRMRDQMILNSYYTKKIKRGKNLHATLIDWIFLIILLILFFLITIYNSTNSFFFAILLTVFLISFYVTISILWKKRTRHTNIEKVNNDLADKQIIKEISKYGNRDFLLYIKDLAEKYYDTIFFEYDKSIDFIGEINEEIYGIKCFKNSLDNRVNLKDLEHFIREMESKNMQEGIIFTSSYFADEVKENTNYLLMDFDQMKNMLKKTESYPSKKEIEDLIISKYNRRKSNLKERFKTNDKRKMYKFILLGIVLYLISSFVTYKSYYRIMAFLSIGVGIIIGVYNTIKYLKQRQKEY